MYNNKKGSINIFALAAQGVGISGSDRIFIEFARRWVRENNLTIYVCPDGLRMCERQNLTSPGIKYHVLSIRYWQRLGFVGGYLGRIVEGIRLGFSLRLNNSQDTIIYSASEFWMDSLPCVILKMRYPQINWAASWYQTAPNPIKGFAEGERSGKHRLRAFLYWFVQLPIKPLIAKYADAVLVNNETERKVYPELDKRGKAIVVIGAVDTKTINKWKMENGKLRKVHDAVFQGRFHPQKGVVELVEIWKKVVDKKPDAKLVMIGDGPLMGEVRSKIKELRLEKNITLLGYVFDGDEKYKTFAKSKLVVHPAFYDSGGMASAEAMAFGMPCIGFDLKSYESYYPYGMMKVKIGDTSAFAKAILAVLDDKKIKRKLSNEAVEMINKTWAWDKRAEDILVSIKK